MLEYLMRTYARLPAVFRRGEGAWLEDGDGRRYLDALSGIGVCGLGHAHPEVAEAVADQARTLVHTSNLYRIPLQEELARALCERSGMDTAFFGSSGAEANEAAIKLARLYGHQRGLRTPTVMVMDGAFHGRTLGTLTATGSRKAQAGFDPLVSGFVRVPYNDLEAAHRAAANSHDLTAVLVEPIQGEGGIVLPDPDYLAGLRRLCDEQGWLLMVDEVQSGMGRTGRWFAFQHSGIAPDVVTVAKALGNGVPIGACLARGKAAEVFQPGNHGSTFGGNPLACRAALTVIETIERDGLLARAAELGERMQSQLRDGLSDLEGVREVRGRGLMLGIELAQPCTDLVHRALEQELLINVTAERVVRLLPPLILSDEEAERITGTTIRLIDGFLARNAATAGG